MKTKFQNMVGIDQILKAQISRVYSFEFFQIILTEGKKNSKNVDVFLHYFSIFNVYCGYVGTTAAVWYMVIYCNLVIRHVLNDLQYFVHFVALRMYMYVMQKFV